VSARRAVAALLVALACTGALTACSSSSDHTNNGAVTDLDKLGPEVSKLRLEVEQLRNEVRTLEQQVAAVQPSSTDTTTTTTLPTG
jgi:uncharacterized protein YlxW (UPF0749 family)